jgi:hypothetical protein
MFTRLLTFCAVLLVSVPACSSSSSHPANTGANASNFLTNQLGGNTLQILATQVICGGAQLVGGPLCHASIALANTAVLITAADGSSTTVTTDANGAASAELANGQYQVALVNCPSYDQCPVVNATVNDSSAEADVQEIIDAP